MFLRSCTQLRIRCWLLHIFSKDNYVADRLSRGKWADAEAVVRTCGLEPIQINRSAQMAKWASESAEWAQTNNVLEQRNDGEERMTQVINEVEETDIGLRNSHQ